MSEKKWCYSYNGENFEGDFVTKEDAVEEASCYINSKDDREYIYIGNPKEISIGVNVDAILENIGEDAYEQAGEYAVDYLRDVTIKHGQILEERLNEVLYNWMDEYNYKPYFWKVENVEKIKINEHRKDFDFKNES
jgi:hypothetical protein